MYVPGISTEVDMNKLDPWAAGRRASLDILIGAHARSLGLTLVTNNRREFDRMPGLKVENWF